jgi:hypothetical protein
MAGSTSCSRDPQLKHGCRTLPNALRHAASVVSNLEASEPGHGRRACAARDPRQTRRVYGTKLPQELRDLEEIPAEYRGWWRITETSRWSDGFLDSLGPALLSLNGCDDRLRMHCLLAYVNHRPTKTGVSFTWEGAWEYDQMSGSGRVTLGKDGRLKGSIRIKDGDSSTFVAVRTEEPDEPIPPPPSYRDKRRRRR